MAFQPFKPKPTPLNLLLIGQQGAGKTTACASLLRLPTLLLYVSSLESHSPEYMSKGTVLYEGAKPENLFATAVDMMEDGDLEILPSLSKFKVGDKLPPDAAMAKLYTYLKVAKGNVSNCVVDSLSAMMSIIKLSSEWKALCATKDGNHNNFAESPAFVTVLQKVMAALKDLNDSGINCVTICGAKAVELDQATKDVVTVCPHLPAYGVVEQVVFYYPDIAIITEETEYPPYTRMLNFGVEMEKTSKEQTGKIKKFLNVKPRLKRMPLGLDIPMLPPDFLKLDEFIAQCVDQEKS